MARKGQRVDTPVAPTDDEGILLEAQRRFQVGLEYYGDFRSRALQDKKFYYGDSDNHYQWPLEVRKNRQISKRPRLTINQTRQFCLNVLNEARQRKMAIDIDPVGDEASYEGCQVMEGIIRHITARSRGMDVIDNARMGQVIMGRGYWRVLSEYEDPESFAQELRFAPVNDALSVLTDPAAAERDKSDMEWAFIFEDVPRDKFEFLYPDYMDVIGTNKVGQLPGWIDKNQIKVCEYYRRQPVKYMLYALQDEEGNLQTWRDDQVPKEILDEIKKTPGVRKRQVIAREVEWYKIVGNTIVDRRTAKTKDLWPGSTIPLITLIGEESVIEGQFDCKGHVRYLKDPNRIYNYWTSGAVEQVALQSKTPWVGPAKAIEELQEYWSSANTTNHAYLPYNHVDKDGQPVPPPQRADPPQMAAAYVQGMQIAASELRMASGQYEEDLGSQGTAMSGVAIANRVRQSNIATQHFSENEATALEYCGRILLEVIPHFYDTRRVLRILGEDGSETAVLMDPEHQGEYRKIEEGEELKASLIFNPGFAKYSVRADVGPAYSTQREEAFQAFEKIIALRPELTNVAGDLLFKAADFPMAEELAERLRRMVPPQALGEGPSPAEEQLQQQVQELQSALQNLFQEYSQEKLKSDSKEQAHLVELYRTQIEHVVDEFKAETERLKVVGGGFSPEQISQLVQQAVEQTLATRLPELSTQ